MTRNDLLEKLSVLDLEREEVPIVQVFILAEPQIKKGTVNCPVYKARLHERMPEEIAKTYYPRIKKTLVSRQYELIGYDPALMPDYDAIWFYDSATVPFYKCIEDQLPASKTYYDSKKLSYEDIWAIWIQFQVGDAVFCLIKKMLPSKVLLTGSSLSLIFSSNVFHKLESDILTLDGTFDVLSCGDTLYFENKRNFEKALLFEAVKKNVAETTLDEIDRMDFLENFDRIREFLRDDYHAVGKLNHIKSKPYFQDLTFTHCKQITDDYGLNLAYDAEKEKFSIRDKNEAKTFIKILNDDYLKSEMTQLRYAANSKESI